MFDEYMKDAGNLYAFEDDKKGFVSAKAVETAYEDALMNGKYFIVDNFTENAGDTDILKDVTVGYEWKNNGIVSISDDNTTSISLNKTSDTLKVGDTDTLTAAVTSNNTTSNNVTWTSSDESIASVDQTGKVTAVKEGTAAITATAADGNTKAVCTVTVTGKDTDNMVVTFKDANLEKAVRDAINKPTGTLYKSDVDKITELDIDGYLSDENNLIKDISGIEYLVNLQDLNLGNNAISDINPLKQLINLQRLRLIDNNIKDISSLQGLTNLQELELSNNQISNISSLQGLTSLQNFSLGNNQINHIGELKGLNNLQYLNLSGKKTTTHENNRLSSSHTERVNFH